MKKSYLKGAIIVLIFIFFLFIGFNFFNSAPMLSPGSTQQDASAFDVLLILIPLVAGFLIVVLAFFLIIATDPNN